MADWGEKLKESDWEPAGIDLNDKDMMKLVFSDLGIAEDYRMQTKLRAFIRRLQEPKEAASQRKCSFVSLSCCVDVVCCVCSPVTLKCLY